MTSKYFDIHSHVNFAAYDADREEVISRAHEALVGMINVGTQKESSESAIALAEKYEEGIFATVGVHPTHLTEELRYHDANEFTEKEFQNAHFEWDEAVYMALASHPKVVAIGECGLDYYRLSGQGLTPDIKKLQHDIFSAHIALANKLGKPLMLHIRPSKGTFDAYLDAYTLLKHEAKVRGNVHFFVGSLDIAKKFWDMGFSTSFTGVITFTRDYDEVVRAAPSDALMSETDCPYVSPAPFRGKRNEPVYVIETVKKMAHVRGEKIEQTAAQLMHTVHSMFRLKQLQ